jgi:phage recombination protein Bet
MSNLVPVQNGNSIAVQPTWTAEQVDLIRRTYAKDCNDDELKLFLYIATRSGLDPFARQIYAVKRDGKMVIQTSIDGFRLTAMRTGSYAGRDEAVFEYDSQKNPVKCKVVIYKLVQGVRCAFTATAKWAEYYPGDKLGFMWRKLPETMLEKCCEAKALRMAFPAELSLIYSKEEMDQADSEAGRIVPQQPEPGDGDTSDDGVYKIDFGKWNRRTIEEVYRNHGPGEIESYIGYLEKEADKKGKPLSPPLARFVSEAGRFLAAMENGEINLENERKNHATLQKN